MNWLLAYLIWSSLSIGIFFVLRNKKFPLRKRLLSAFALSVPLLFYIVDYQKASWQNAQDCKVEYGLKVFVKPEKANAVQVLSDTGSTYGEGYLKQFYPRLKYVEIADNVYSKPRTYSNYSVVSTTDNRFKKGWIFNKTPITHLNKGLFTISKTSEYDKTIYRHKDVWSLTKDGQVYATYTQFYRLWPRIRYPDAVPSFHCSDLGYEENVNPTGDLIKLILK